ncbi:MAG: 3D domain-containing protein [Vicinamibacterales bacterium]
MLGFLLAYEASVSDSRLAVRWLLNQPEQPSQQDRQEQRERIRPVEAEPTSGASTPPAAGDSAFDAGESATFTATAYCKGSITASGVAPKRGVAAADPDLLPVGSVVQLDSVDKMYSGIYTIMDTGPAVRGATIDIYMWSCHEALRFGRRLVQLLVLRRGWDPRRSDLADSLLPWRDLKRAPLPF